MARDIIQSGRIGRLMAVSGQWAARKVTITPRPGVVTARLVYLTNLIHEIDILRFICGDIASVSAEMTDRDQHFERGCGGDQPEIRQSGGWKLSAFGSYPVTWTWEMALGECEIPEDGYECHPVSGHRGRWNLNLVLWRHAEGW